MTNLLAVGATPDASNKNVINTLGFIYIYIKHMLRYYNYFIFTN